MDESLPGFGSPVGGNRDRVPDRHPREPAAQPVVRAVVHDIEEGLARSRRDRPSRLARNRRFPRRAVPEQGRRVRRRCALGQERPALAQDERVHIARRRLLPAFRIDPALSVRADRLVRRHGIDRKETGRMAGQPVEADHAQPVVHGVERAGSFALDEPCAEVRPGRTSTASWKKDAQVAPAAGLPAGGRTAGCRPAARRALRRRAACPRRGRSSMAESGLMSQPTGRTSHERSLQRRVPCPAP